MKQGEFQYRAFISYSHADRRVAEWLHRALETYRVPAKLVGTLTPLGPVPAKLGRFFRDRDELPASGDLSAELTQALKHSMFLVVICSPSAAKSRWVNEEVRQFKLLHGRKRGDGTARVLALIADGDPGDAGGGACFPAALNFHVLPDGQISDDPAEPIAADIRPGGDGKRLALMKLVAGLTGLPLDSLVQREAARRQRRAALLSGASLVLAGVMAVLAVLAVQGRREAERQRAQADGLVEFMLTDLREKLEPVGRLEVLDSVGQRALAYYAAQDISALTPDELGRRARALHLVGEVRDLRGDSEGALKAFREAERTTAEQLARDPENPDRMFDHAQSVFYVGQMAWQRRDADTAENRFRRYVELADQMLATDPANPRWQAEVGYAANGLGVVLLDRGRLPEAVKMFERYVAVTAQLAAAKPKDADAAWEHGQARAWLADAQYAAGNLESARAERMAERAILDEVLAAEPNNTVALFSRARTDWMLGTIDLAQGKTAASASRTGQAWRDAQALLARDPANTLWRGLAVDVANGHAEALLLAGQWEQASQANRWARTNAEALLAADPKNRRLRMSTLMPAQWMEIAILFGEDRDAEARAALARSADRHGAQSADDASDTSKAARLAVHLMTAADLLARRDAAAARAHAASALQPGTVRSDPRQQALAASLEAIAEGRPQPRSATAYPAHALVAAVQQ